MMNTNNPILNAVISKLIADRDEALVKFDLIVNKNQSDSGVSGIVSEAFYLAKHISQTEVTIDWVQTLIEENDSSNEMINKIKELQDAVSGKNTENNTNNDNNGNNS